jgi:hypothetical protein
MGLGQYAYQRIVIYNYPQGDEEHVDRAVSYRIFSKL